jgi:two-component system chemotaxis sensor kinase CheA
MNMDQVMHTFIAESRELLEQMEDALLEVGREADDASRDDGINAIFRAAHTIKGSAGMFGLDPLVDFTHVAESVLDKVREGAVPVSEALVALLLACCDHIAALVDAVDAGTLDGNTALTAAGAPLLDALQAYLDGPAAPTAAAHLANDAAGDAAGGERQWRIALRFGADTLRNGMDPLSFIRYLGQLGTITDIATLADRLPAAAEFDPESCYLGFDIGFTSSEEQAAIEGVFDFVREDCEILIAPQAEAAAPPVAVPAPVAAVDMDAPTDGAPARQRQESRQEARQEKRSVRVDADKLDRLIDLVGELIIAGASANVIARRVQVADLLECTSTLSGLVEEVRDSALQLRMVKIGATFNRFQRVVHDVSRELGKDIRLQVNGEDAELDKTVVEKIGDPLTHLVRNAMDHGIEPLETRLARGKPAHGTVALNAYHESGSIVIEVSDDGGGLRRERILAKAIERGLAEPGRSYSDKEIFGLIFEPGFSTAEQVTNLSGRGVGMDVVKRNIVALRGSVEIASTEGKGTTVTVRLPLTLAIINGFQVGVGKSVFVIPMEMVEECVEFREDPGHDYIDLRGRPLPFVRLRERFGIAGAPARRRSIVVVRYGSRKAGLVVDHLLGEFQTVIKPLGKVFAGARFLSGSSILGNGEVALILDMAALLTEVETENHTSTLSDLESHRA